jgi:glutaminase
METEIPHVPVAPQGAVDNRERQLFDALDLDRRGWLRASEILAVLHRVGLDPADRRLREVVRRLQHADDDGRVTFDEFCDLVRPNILLVERAVRGDVVIPDFRAFSQTVHRLFEETRSNRTGHVATYIPQLGRVEPEQYGLALCTIDGQRLHLGDSDVEFCVQSCCKPINYCLALEAHGETGVHRHVGREPSGRGFNELTLDFEGKPHNPMINAGAVMCCALIEQGKPIADRFDEVMNQWRRLAGGQKPNFSNAVYLSERATADRNFALGYMMRERGVFPAHTDLVETLEFYFQCCSIELDCQRMATVAATLANGGVCPTTGERVFSADTVRRCLSLMQSCGMYDFSGEFAFTVGLPAKSGVAGAIMLVVPNVLGLCVWSPRLDRNGNSVRGIDLCRRLVEVFNFHPFDDLSGLSGKQDPRRTAVHAQMDRVLALIWAASKGDVTAVQREIARGADPKGADYDGRSALHLAASEGHAEVVSVLLALGALPHVKDRWGGTPLDDAKRHGHADVVKLLEPVVTGKKGK